MLKIKESKKIPSRIKIMRIVTRMNIGGPALQISGLMESIDDKIFEHRLYTGLCSPKEGDYLIETKSGIESFCIPSLTPRINIFNDLRALVFLWREIRTFKPHIIHTHTSKAGFLGRLASILSLHPSLRIHTFHGHLLDGYFSKFTIKTIILCEIFLAKFTTNLISVGNKVKEDLIRVGIGNNEKFIIIYPGFKLSNLPKKQNARNTLNLNQHGIYCAFVGRMTKIKRPDRFLEVVSELKQKGVEINFFIAGDGELMDFIDSYINTNDLPVTLLSWQSHIEVVLAAADMILLTSDNEGTPTILIQAGMAGLPSVATNVGSVSEIILNNTTGFLVGKSTQEIVSAVERLALDKNIREELGNSAKKHTEEHFSESRFISMHHNLYLSLIEKQFYSTTQ